MSENENEQTTECESMANKIPYYKTEKGKLAAKKYRESKKGKEAATRFREKMKKNNKTEDKKRAEYNKKRREKRAMMKKNE